MLFDPFQKLDKGSLGIFSDLPEELLDKIEDKVEEYNNEKIENMTSILVKNGNVLRKRTMKVLLKNAFESQYNGELYDRYSARLIKVMKM